MEKSQPPDPVISEPRSATAQRSLVDLLGEQRATITQHLRDRGSTSVGDLAEHLGISDVATRRHVDRLAEDGLVDSRTVNTGRGRPVAQWSLTERGLALFPTRYDELAHQLLDFLADNGREELGRFLRWRQERQVAAYADDVDADDLADRVQQLAELLTRDGYRAEADSDGDGFTLRQQHCTIADVAAEQPLLCAHEAAAFGRLLGQDVSVTRRETIAKGDGACVCHVQLREPRPNALPVIPIDSPTTSCCDGPASAAATTTATSTSSAPRGATTEEA